MGSNGKHAVDLIIWDLDGTLADTVEDIADSANRTLAAMGLGPRTVDEVKLAIGGGIRNLLATVMGVDESEDRVEEAVTAFRTDYTANLVTKTRLFPGAREVLDALTAQGKKQAVISNKLQTMTREIVEALGVSHHFVDVIGQGGDHPIKPDPTSTLAVIGSAGTTPERTAFIGDSSTDFDTARNAGCISVLVTYGMRPPDEVRALTADAHIDDLKELLSVLS